MYELHHGDCLDILKTLKDNSIDSIVTDPPYGISFMGRHWDYDVPSVEIWAECLRVLKPGGHLLAFAGTRTQHRMAVRIEDAGFEIRDMIAWVYGSGFPKSLDVSKALEAYAKTGRSDSQVTGDGRSRLPSQHYKDFRRGNAPKADFNPTTDAARQWQGWGTALKPALEPITVARKPLVGTVAANVLEHGTGALNTDGCRIEGRERTDYGLANSTRSQGSTYGGPSASADFDSSKGRWPANLIHDGSEEVLANFHDSAGSGGSVPNVKVTGYGDGVVGSGKSEYFGGPRTKVDAGTGSAARFFYYAKASKKDRGEGNAHPTVKPTDLMAYLCRLVTPPGGVVLDPFAGSGSTGKAATLEGFSFIGIEREAEYVAIAQGRIDAALNKIAEELAG